MKGTDSKSNGKWVGATLVAAFLASLCCITPVLAIVAGVSGVASTFSWLDPFRSYLIGFTILALGFAWYQKLKPQKEDRGCACDDEENKKPFVQTKKFLGIITVLAALLLSFPYYSNIFFYQPAKANTTAEKSIVRQAKLNIKGMTCAGCESSVVHALNSKEGVVEAASHYESGIAEVKYDPSLVAPEALKEVIENEVGYQVTKVEVLQP